MNTLLLNTVVSVVAAVAVETLAISKDLIFDYVITDLLLSFLMHSTTYYSG
jgi:hypothetical protein